MHVLYYTPGACSRAAHIAMEDAGADYEPRRVDFAKQEQQSPDYLALNPKGRVPALATPKGVLTENPAILVYIAQTWPAAGLAPLDDPFAFAEMQSFNSYLCATVHVAHAHGRRPYRWANEQSSFDDMRRKVPETMTAAFELIENGFLKGPWVMGDQYTVADAYLYTITGWLEADEVDTARLPRVMAHHARMEERESVQRMLAREGA